VRYETDDVKARALQCARGEYQEGLITGRYSWSGNDLRGRAKNWSGSYWRSRTALIARLREHGLTIESGVLKNA
jgi:hypothetical protein